MAKRYLQSAFTGVLLSALMACSAPEGTSPTERQQTSALAPSSHEEAGQVIVSLDGVRTTGPDGRMLTMGTEMDAVLEQVGAVLGEAESGGTNEECGAGPIDFANFQDGLTLNFQNDRLVGWSSRYNKAESKTSTPEGIAVFSTFDDVSKVYTMRSIEDSTLGDEYSTDEGIGLIFEQVEGDDKKVMFLYSGVNCFFR